ncbi:hypothetical protein BDQ12DRAFT_699831 [Crucibulum laeve]|uniref:FAR-17a/AIG1-like protein n=1 Tax=Crucibulum laeve TaxID=68775 RepID=A0A5C3M4G2_9AGAR|nr:hypothetical protein BDQ12DRAFT_699831 [Crucibulum laeve]
MPFNFYQHLGISSSTTFDTNHKFVTSPLFPRASIALACIRLSIALYTLFVLLFSIIWESVRWGDGEQYFSFFTHLSYIGLCSYFFASGIQTLFYALRLRKGGTGYPLQRWGYSLQALHILLASTVVTFPIIVTIVFWGLLSSPSTFSSMYNSWSAISVHALNVVFCVFEIILTNIPAAPWITLPFGLLFLGGYLGVAYLTKATQGFYTYAFLDPTKQHALLAAYIIGIAVAEIIIFFIVRLIMTFRERYCARRGLTQLSDDEGDMEQGRRDMKERIDEWEEIERPKSTLRS